MAYIQVYIPTDDDRANPDYMDPCVAAGNPVCSYCCVMSWGGGTCSRNVQVCDKLYDREFSELAHMFEFILGVVVGCPVIAIIFKCFLSARFCASWFPETDGTTCFELIFRTVCCCCCNFTKTHRKQVEDDYVGEAEEEP